VRFARVSAVADKMVRTASAAGGGRTLSRRELNRATLARQLLLERSTLPVVDAVAQVAGLQAQVQNPPYIGLWSRLRDFDRGSLTRAMERRDVVRATMMRSTVHVVTAADYLAWRRALSPALLRAFMGFFGDRARALETDAVIAEALAMFEAGPATFVEVRRRMSERWPDVMPETMAYAVRAHLPLVQVPPGGTWGRGGAVEYALAESRLGAPLAESESPADLVMRYLAAWGPATVKDVQTWAGMAKLRTVVDELRPRLRTFRDEAGAELFDVADAPLPEGDAEAPVRFLPDFDNFVLSHFDRSRVMPEEHRKKVLPGAGIVRATFLVDGFVAGTWKIERDKRRRVLAIAPFEKLAKLVRDSVAAEGERLVRWVADDGDAVDVRFEEPRA
jgi:hypothetical protein